MDYLKNIYIMMEVNFLKENGRTVDDDNTDLFPTNWYETENYQLKTEILYEAIKRKVKIVDTDKFQELLEGVKR